MQNIHGKSDSVGNQSGSGKPTDDHRRSGDGCKVDALAAEVEHRVIGWRRDIHANPELGNQEVRTAGIVAKHLKSLGYQVSENVGVTGVVGLLQGQGDGPVVALRADMDALPIVEQTGLPFASTVKAQWHGEEVGVMHACGHDAHTAMLMGAAEVFAAMKDDLPGTVKLIFQPAEEGIDGDGLAGSRAMLADGAFTSPKPDVVFALHVETDIPTGTIGWRAGPVLAATDIFDLTVNGKQTHGALPWGGVDPIVLGSQIVMAFQTIVSRQINLTQQPAVLTVATFVAGSRHNIIPGKAIMSGTVRTYDEEMRGLIKDRMVSIATSIAEANGGSAELTFKPGGYATTVNDPALMAEMLPTLERMEGVTPQEVSKRTASEDFSFFAQQVPGLFMLVGGTPPDADPATVFPNHSPLFQIDEAALLVGVRALVTLTVDYMDMNS